MSTRYLDSEKINPSNDIYQRLQDVERLIGDEVMAAEGKGPPPITYLQLGGDSRGYGFTFHLSDETTLAEAADNGRLRKIAAVSHAAVAEHLELADNAKIHVCFNSDEYVRARGDGFARWHDGDWRDDYVFVLNSKGDELSA